MNKRIGFIVKWHRLKNGYKQTDLCKLLGMSRHSYIQKENGKSAFTVKQLELLAKQFNIDICEFFKE